MDLFLKKAAPTYTEVRNSLDVKSGINSDRRFQDLLGVARLNRTPRQVLFGPWALGLDPLILGLTL